MNLIILYACIYMYTNVKCIKNYQLKHSISQPFSLQHIVLYLLLVSLTLGFFTTVEGTFLKGTLRTATKVSSFLDCKIYMQIIIRKVSVFGRCSLRISSLSLVISHVITLLHYHIFAYISCVYMYVGVVICLCIVIQ